MLPYQLDRILSKQKKVGNICPKCKHGMDYTPYGSSSFYICCNCKHVEFAHPKRGKIKVAKK